jgi:release factor glutamine methyltransferase
MTVTDTVTNSTATLREALTYGVQRLLDSTTARRDAQLLLMRAAGCDRATLLAYPERQITSDQNARYCESIERRAGSEPMQYILGEQEFYGLRFEVNSGVLIPRPETEYLVEALLSLVPADRPLRIADVGTGSGAIAVALAHALPQARVTALDNSLAALAVARSNAELHRVQGQIEFLESNLLGAIEGGLLFDAIVSNPPYIADGERLEPQVEDYEPRNALFAGPTGLEIYQRLIPQAKRHLRPGGWLLLEIGAGQQAAIQELLSGWTEVRFVNDLQGIPRVAISRRC